ncbi:hypothetical protein UCDDA912_g01477 [Diaporthe ampelina]|uniref:Uncharacterized protein n=1 Tax=Diaporthe ampelina TaxID=1214573 RepID=A0A0G2FWT7_9PEZI|nr:hypothetical protein UCDDA912_g01477 [Diaporthe ampelina]
MTDRIPDHELQSVGLNAGAPQWALMALNPSGERQIMVKDLGSGHQSSAVLFRELEGERLSVLKVNRVAHNKERMARPDREVRVARLLASSGGAAHFARLLSSQDLVGGYRTSWWEFYNVGSMRTFAMFIFAEATPPLSLVFRAMGQCLEGIQYNFDKDNDKNQLIFSLFQSLTDMCEQDEQDRKLPEARRPPLQDLTQVIQDAKTLERLYAFTDSDKQALSELRGKLMDLRSQEPLEPCVFDNGRAARDEFKSLLEVGPFRMVNLADENSIEAATAELAALRVKGSVHWFVMNTLADAEGSG